MMLAPRTSELTFAPERLPPLNGNVITLPRLASKGSITSVTTATSSKSSATHKSTSSVASKRSSVTSTTTQHVADFENVPTLIKTPWELERSKRLSHATSRPRQDVSRSLPPRYFQNLPREIYECVLQQLEHLYFDSEPGGCVTCYLQDLYCLSLTNRAWEKAARLQLYSRIWLSIDDSAFRKRGEVARRLKALQWTLRERTALASLVRELNVTDVQQIYSYATPKERQVIIDHLAFIIEACPYLERFSGLILSYDHRSDKLTNALSSRSRLREKIWSIKAAEEIIDENGEPAVVRRPLVGWDVENPDAFLTAHGNWRLLQRLFLFGQFTGSMDYRAFVATFRSLPSLQHLLISNFDSDQFNDRTLQAIPSRLRSLRLQDLPGLTDKGLLKLANSDACQSLRSLFLIHLEIRTIPVLQKFLALPQLRRFAIQQETPPTLPHGVCLAAPIFQSRRLAFLHWDICLLGQVHNDLATSISLGTFPALRKIRAPNDHDGLLQALCKPTGDLLGPRDDKTLISQVEKGKEQQSTLPFARQQAQERIIQARKEPFMKVIVEEDGVLHHKFTFRGFMGKLGSQIEFCLESDVVGSDEPLAGLGDLLITKREDEVGTDGWCSGKGWGDIKPGMEGKKGRTHARKKKVKMLDMGMFF